MPDAALLAGCPSLEETDANCASGSLVSLSVFETKLTSWVWHHLLHICYMPFAFHISST